MFNHALEWQRTLFASSFRYVRMAAAAALALGLTGCLDIDQRMTLHPDGSGSYEVNLRFDQDMEDVAKLFEAYAQYAPDAEKFKDGLCVAAQRFSEAVPHPDKRLQVRQFRIDDRFICQFRFMVNTIEGVPMPPPLELESPAPRRYRISVDLSRFPDEGFLQAELLAALREQLPPDSFGIPQNDFAQLWGRHVTAAVALTRIFMRNRYVQFTVAAPRIVEHNGTLSADGESVTFRFSFGELAKLALDANARKVKRYYVVVEH